MAEFTDCPTCGRSSRECNDGAARGWDNCCLMCDGIGRAMSHRVLTAADAEAEEVTVGDVDTLRAAAAAMRSDPDGRWQAVGDWLDTAGADLWAHGPLCECGSGCYDCDDDPWQPHARRALAVARAYLGGTDE